MTTAVRNFVFEIEENLAVAEVERFIDALGEIKKDDTIKLEDRKLIVITTTRPDVAAVLEPIFKPAQIKRPGRASRSPTVTWARTSRTRWDCSIPGRMK